MHRWAPEAIVAPLDVVLSLADRKLRGLADLDGLRVAVVLTDIDSGTLAEAYREFLWQALGVPVFEQLRDGDGTVIARECEAHDGLHVDRAAKITPGMASALVNDHCECGSEDPRLRNYASTRVPNADGTWNEVVPVARQVT